MSQTPKKGGRGLGRGFEALISADFQKDVLLTPEDRIEKIAVAKLQANPYQPRKHFEDKHLEELSVSIKQYGVIQPLIATPATGGMYTLIAGERRWRASKLAGLESVPVVIRSSQALEQLEIALIENVQRVDLSPLEQALSIERLREQFSLSYETIAERLGKAVSTVVNTVRLLKLPEAARDALAAEEISEGHARTLLSLNKDPERQTYLLNAIKTHGWSVRQAERFVTSVKAGVKETASAHARTASETPETKRLSKHIGYPVSVRRTARGGKLEIGFTSDEELERIMHLLNTTG